MYSGHGGQLLGENIQPYFRGVEEEQRGYWSATWHGERDCVVRTAPSGGGGDEGGCLSLPVKRVRVGTE